jgi:predicted TIM-barrel fold metal-dependent hydrolase
LTLLDHLCKPNLSQSTPSPRWKSALSRLAADRNVYMKLSGAFNEFDSTPSTVPEIATALSPFVDIVFETFPDSVMFGSDWPVCNVGGPRGESGNWPFWMEVVESVMTKRDFSDHQKGSVWWRAASDAYALSL